MFRFLVVFETSSSFYSEKRSLNILPEITFSSKLDKQERNELILSCYKRKRGNELDFLIHREQREATSTGSLKKNLTLKILSKCWFGDRFISLRWEATSGRKENSITKKILENSVWIRRWTEVYQQCVLVFICISHASVTCFVSSWSRFEAEKWNKREAVQAELN